MFPQRLGRGLGALFDGDHHVVHIKDKFNSGSLKDEDWIGRLAAEGGWSFLSGDMQIAKKRPSRDLVLRSNLIGFFPAASILKRPFEDQVIRILKTWPLMERISSSTERGVYELTMQARLRQIS
jgi:PIN like domain